MRSQPMRSRAMKAQPTKKVQYRFAIPDLMLNLGLVSGAEGCLVNVTQLRVDGNFEGC